MKIQNIYYQKLSSAIIAVLSNYTEERIQEHRKTVKYVKSQFIAFCWSILHHDKTNIVAWLYSNGFHDQHIETATKKMLKKYE